MKIAAINTGAGDQRTSGEARAFLPELLKGLTGKGNEVHLIVKGAPIKKVFAQIEESDPLLHISLLKLDAMADQTAAPAAAANWLTELNPDVYLIWTSDTVGWAVLPLLDPSVATLAVGHADSETYYAPARHYRPFLTRVIGTTPEVCVGFVINCVIDKERVEWISDGELEGSLAETTDAEIQKVIETYESCFEKAIRDAHAAPREKLTDFPPMKTNRPSSQSWFGKLKGKIMK